MSSIFSNTGTGTGPGLFGSSTQQNQPTGTGLFGSSTTQNQNQNQPSQQGGGLFGGSNTQQNPPTQGGGLFGGSTTQPNPPPQNQPQQQNTGIFGGGSTTQNQQPQQQQQGGLFGGGGGAQNQQQPQQQQQQNTSIFPSQTGTTPNPSASLFPPPQPQRSFAERTFANPQQVHLSSLLQSGLGANTSAFGNLGLSSQADAARSRLRDAGLNATPNEKTVYDQVQTVVRKWDPQSADTLMQAYLYNAVNSAYAPFYYRSAEESEQEWEEALAKKPSPIENKDGTNVSFVPVLVRGFRALGDRVEYQARTINEMRARLHEMNNSLDAVMGKHQQNLTVRLENAQRQHAALSARCLRLAVKAQILRHRGYPLDSAEEGLRRTLQGLETQVLDPAFGAREEEIWARMVALRERARWLEEEGRRLGDRSREEQENQGGGVSEEVLVKTKRILRDYDGQLVHLARELGEVGREFEEWRDGYAHGR